PGYSFGGPAKADGFNLNVVQLTLDKPLDDSDWAAGYRVDLWLGPDANILGSQSVFAAGGSASPGDLAIRQAYVALRTPVGNGINWKVGVWDTIVGYEVLSSPDNPNFTRSWGFTIEPTTHTGVHAGYQINGWLAAEAAVANTFGPSINARANPPKAESFKAYMGSLALTAPEDWGWAAGSTLKVAVINGFDAALGDNRTHFYAGGTLNTPVTGLKLGVAFDYADFHNQPAGTGDHAWVLGGYASFQATEKLSFHGRGEYYFADGGAGSDTEIFGTTFTVQYDLWKNVLSRVEFRWDHSAEGDLFGGQTAGSPTRKNAFVLLANVAYKF
ncbi:MAG: porin, partial [Verrucomicrobiae bacterium]|nr:porin [Verrucomicrobiae bacterium]